MTTLSYIYMAESQFKSVRWNGGANERDLSHMVKGPTFLSLALSCRGQGIGKHRGTISGWHKRTAGRNLVVHRLGFPASRGPFSVVFAELTARGKETSALG